MKLILLMAITADGIIAKDKFELVDWTGKEDKKHFVLTTKKAKVVIMGSKTYDTIGKPLIDRKNIVLTRNKKRKSKDKQHLVFTDQSPKKILKALEKEGFESAVLIGGSKVNTLFIKENLINEIHLTIVPKLFGKGLCMFKDFLNVKLNLIDVQKIGKTHILLKYKIN